MQTAIEEAREAKSTQRPAGPRAGGGGGGGMFSSPDLMIKLSMDPRTRGFLGQPDFMRMLSDVQNNPGSMASYLHDARFKLVSMGSTGVWGFGLLCRGRQDSWESGFLCVVSYMQAIGWPLPPKTKTCCV